MKDNKDKHLDKLIDRVMGEMPLKSPSMDFTANILSKVNVLPKSEVTVYKPLISKNIWFFIGALMLGLLAYVVFKFPLEETGWFSSLELGQLPTFKMPAVFSGITISKTFMYSIVVFAVLLFVQIPLLKKQFDKRLEY